MHQTPSTARPASGAPAWRRLGLGLAGLATAVLLAHAAQAQPASRVDRVDGAYIQANAAKSTDWPSHGLDYAETRFSRLQQINIGNVGQLGLVWSYNLESTRGVESTPLVVDGVMYVTASWSVVHAVDVRSG